VDIVEDGQMEVQIRGVKNAEWLYAVDTVEVATKEKATC
jgi:hypothetical protein